MIYLQYQEQKKVRGGWNMSIVEVCCGSVADCVAAYHGGAHRIELNSALHLGGLTPSLASLRKAKEKVKIPVIAMVRPRAAGFCYQEEEIEVMMMDAKLFLEAGVDGIAFGFLLKDGNIDFLNTKAMVALIKSFGQHKEAVFHRAFDCTPDPYIAIHQCIDLQVDRILTSGLEVTAIEGKEVIRNLVERANHQIEIVAGSAINEANVTDLIKFTGVKQVHSSCKAWAIDKTTTANRVSYAYHGSNDYEIVDEEKVVNLVKQCK